MSWVEKKWREPLKFGAPSTWKDEATFTKADQVADLSDNDQNSFIRIILDSTPQLSAEEDKPQETWNWLVPRALGQGPGVTLNWQRVQF